MQKVTRKTPNFLLCVKILHKLFLDNTFFTCTICSNYVSIVCFRWIYLCLYENPLFVLKGFHKVQKNFFSWIRIKHYFDRQVTQTAEGDLTGEVSLDLTRVVTRITS